jgi:hypothetical protein
MNCQAACAPELAAPVSVRKKSTKSVGDRSEAAVLSALIRKGFLISIPFGENHRYDLIADDGQRLIRIQVKTGHLRKGSVRYNCFSSHAHRRPGSATTRPYFGEVEYIGVFCPENEKVYLVPVSEVRATYSHLRVDPTGNGQSRRIRWAAKFELA